MKKTLLTIAVLALLSSANSVYAQDSTNTPQSTSRETIALYSVTAVMIPMAIAGTVISVVPPSFGVVMKEGVSYGTINFETGYGVGEKRNGKLFSDFRLTLNYTHIYNSKIRDIFRAEVKKDFHFDFIDRRKIFLSGVHCSVGLLSDFPNHGYTAGAGLWLKTPWLGFLGFIPEHTFGVTYRYNSYFSGKSFHEVTLGAAAAFTF
ncbi:MAG: hypothetical protein PHP42_14145 [Bacteroidota bacterium]|nr:hypothetical protein [Bacteroidota bacterium]